jgi:polysaccharide pyruvyl transferase WcaK-like protein
LTPYTGGNLGDAAIQEAVIANIRARHGDAEIVGFTLSPEDTARLHCIPCFPLAALSIRHYAPPLTSAPEEHASPRKHGRLSGLKHLFRRARPIYGAFKLLYGLLVAMPRRLSAEIKHIRRSFALVKDLDLLVVSGGGQLDDYWGGPWGHPFSLLKWGLLARATGTRFVFMSVGACAINFPLSAFFMKHALHLATYRSYRDQTSREILAQIADVRRDLVLPDLVFSFAARGLPGTRTSSEGMMIGVSPMAYLSDKWPKENLAIYEKYLEELNAFLVGLLREGMRLCLFITDVLDIPTLARLTDHLKSFGFFRLGGNISVVQANTVYELVSHIASVDFVVASRLHGVLLSHLLNKPVVAISYDRKVTTYMADVEQSEYCLDIHGFDSTTLSKTLKTLISRGSVIQSLLKERTDAFEAALQAQYDAVLGPAQRNAQPNASVQERQQRG